MDGWEKGRGFTVAAPWVVVVVVLDVATPNSTVPIPLPHPDWYCDLFRLMTNGLDSLGHGHRLGNFLKKGVLVVLVGVELVGSIARRRICQTGTGSGPAGELRTRPIVYEKPATVGMNGLDDGIGDVSEYHKGMKWSRSR